MPNAEQGAFYSGHSSEICVAFDPGGALKKVDEREEVFRKGYEVITSPGGRELWSTHGTSLRSMHQRVVVPLLKEYYGGESNPLYKQAHSGEHHRLKLDVISPQTIFVGMLEKKTQQLVGFTYAQPSRFRARDETDIAAGKITEDDYEERQRRTAEVGWTIIHPDHRSQGGWSHIMDLLEHKLLESENYDGMTRVVRMANGYAHKIRTRYAGRITNEFPLLSAFGPQVFFRIALR